MAAAESGRDVAYFTFDDAQVMQDIFEMYDSLVKSKKTVGKIFILN